MYATVGLILFKNILTPKTCGVDSKQWKK